MMPYIHRFKDRHGKIRYYYRRAGQKKPLRGDPGSAEFMADYAAASTLLKAGGGVPNARGEPGSIARLVSDYMASTQFRRLKASSQAVQRRIYMKLAEEHGPRAVAQMRRAHVDRMVAEKAATPGAANSFLKRMKSLMVYAVRNGWIETDPTYRMEAFPEGEHHTWDEDEIAQFEAFWPAGSKQRLAFALHIFTGQRRSDVHKMTWADIQDGGIWVTQTKSTRGANTGTRLWLPLHDDLVPILGSADHATSAIVVTDYGKPFSVAGYGMWINEAIRAAGLPPRCVAHGLRKAAARRLAESGCSAKQIAAITGHKTLAEVERYTRAADQKRMAKAAMEMQKAARAGQPRIDN